MGQEGSKGQLVGNAAPFENYQGPPLGPPPLAPPTGLVTAQYNQSGGRVVAVDDGQPFWDEEPPYLPQPQAQPLPRTARGNLGPSRGMPRRGPFLPPPDRSVVNAPGYASQLRDGMMVEAARDAAWYRSAPPSQPGSSQGPSGYRQPNIKTVRTVIDEKPGYRPPVQAQSYQPQSYQAPQTYQVQAQPQSYAQPQVQAQQPQQVLYYDPKTGQLSSAGQQQVAQAVAPQVVGYQQPQAQVLGYAQPQVAYQAAPQVLGYQQPAQPVMFAYPQQQQAQPIVVPGQLFTATGGVQQLG